MRVGITGAYGFFGWHMRCFLASIGVMDVRSAGRQTFESQEALREFLRDRDVVLHFAGVNRAESDAEIEEGNVVIAEALVQAAAKEGVAPHVVYSSSTKVDGDTVYGKAKKRVGEIIGGWAESAGAMFSNVVFPHLFGECGEPFYNSAVHTFCHQLAHGENLNVNPGGKLELLHAQDAAAYAWNAVVEKREGVLRPSGRKIGVESLAETLTDYHRLYTSGVIPDLRDDEDRKLFNTLRTAMYPAAYPFYLKRNDDPRGWLFESIRELNGGQAFVSLTHPGYTRGNHYHRFKVERFCVLAGSAVIRIRKLFSDSVEEFQVSGDEPCFIDMPPLHTHSISNESDSDVVTMFWSNEFFDPENPDTYPADVLAIRECKS
jgi:UDP-2-acetamido-2,6-beta-L-arabino-hexul-4-ose reductase